MENLAFYLKGCALAAPLLVVLGVFTGCQEPQVSNSLQLAAFESAGPITPQVDTEQITLARRLSPVYRVIPGDVLEFYMPAVLNVTAGDIFKTPEGLRPYQCRVNQVGKVPLPIVGEIVVDGKSLDEIEALILQAYYPKYVVDPPAIVGRVVEHRTQSVSVVGAVKNPGTYHLRSDEMTLVTALMNAAGIAGSGAGVIRIYRPGEEENTQEILLPVKETNIPFVDVELVQGDMIEVEPLDPYIFTVIGLVKRPGAFPYPPGARYNVLQALAFGGGLNELADPQFVRVYRQDANSEIIDATFRITGTGITDASNVQIKPGDVVAVEQTDRTRTRVMLAQILRFGTGATLVYRINDRGD